MHALDERLSNFVIQVNRIIPFLRRVISAAVERITAQDSPDRFHRSDDRTVLLDRFDEVAAAGWSKLAIRSKPRR